MLLKIKPFTFSLLYAVVAWMVLSLSLTAQELPAYCKNFPSVNGELDALKENLNSQASQGGELAYTLCDETREKQVPVEVTDILDYWSNIEEVQNQESVENFQDKITKKVFKAIAQSSYPYKGVFPEKDCQKEISFTRAKSSEVLTCEREYDFIPKCNNPDFQEILEDVDDDHTSFRQEEARIELAQAGLEDFSSEEVEEQALNEAYDLLDEKKKLNYFKAHLENSLKMEALIKMREQAEKKYQNALDSLPPVPSTACRGVCRARGRNSGCQECKDRLNRPKELVEKNYQMEKAEIEGSLGGLYEKTPSLFSIENEWRFSTDFLGTKLEANDFANKLKSRFYEKNSDASELNEKELLEFINSEEAQEKLAQGALDLYENEDSQIEELAREQSFAERRKKKEAMEEICDGDIDDLHLVPALASEIIEESMNSNQANGKSELMNDQAAYCYLLQTRPGDEGGLGLGSVLGASALIAGGVAVQFIPGIGQVAGVGALGAAAGIMGGGVLAYDSFDRYASASDDHSRTKAAFHGSTAWANSGQLFESRDRLNQQRILAGAEVAMVAVDGLLVVRPAVSLATRLATRNIGASRAAQVDNIATSSADSAETVSEGAREVANVTSDVSRERSIDFDRIRDLQTPGDKKDVPSSQKENQSENQSQNAPMIIENDVPLLPADNMVRSQTPNLSRREQALQRFRAKKLEDREAESAILQSRLKSGEQVSEEEFLIHMMQQGRYQSSFTPGVQNMSLDLKKAIDGNSDKQEALEVVREYFDGLPSSSSANRLARYEKMIDEVYDARNQSVSREIVPVDGPASGRSLALIEDGNTSGTSSREVIQGDILVAERPTKNTPVVRDPNAGNVFENEAVDVPSGSFSLRSDTPSSRPRIEADAPNSPSGGFNFLDHLNRNKLRYGAGAGLGFGAYLANDNFSLNLERFWSDLDEEESINETDTNDQADETSEAIKITVSFVGDEPEIEPGQKELSLEVTAEMDNGEDLVDGEFKWTCVPLENDPSMCDDVNLSETGASQSVKLFKQVPYSLEVTYEANEEGYKIEGASISGLQMNCGGLNEDLCSDEASERSTASEGDEENVREPFWWEDLEPNTPPPQFQPGSPLQMRTFILPGFI